jgi:RimJ/RimL family protein N-acetyltransferase
MAEEVRRLTDDPAVTGAVDFLPERVGIEDARRLIRATETGRDVFLGLHEREDRSLVGIVGAHLRALEAIEIGYWVGGSARGRGYGAEGVNAVVRTLAEAYPRRAVVAECRPENVASWNMLHGLGFRPTGDGGQRPGRKLMVWDVRDAAQKRRTGSSGTRSR